MVGDITHLQVPTQSVRHLRLPLIRPEISGQVLVQIPSANCTKSDQSEHHCSVRTDGQTDKK
jgi:hypothetical protein